MTPLQFTKKRKISTHSLTAASGYRDADKEVAPLPTITNPTPSGWNDFQGDLQGYCLPFLEKAMAPHSSTLAWKIPWTEEPGRLQSMGSLRVGHNWATWLSLFTFLHWRRKWQPTPVFLPGESPGRGSLVGCHLWGRTESDTTEATQQVYILTVSCSEYLLKEIFLWNYSAGLRIINNKYTQITDKYFSQNFP